MHPSSVVGTELLINVTPTENRVALLERGQLQEVHIERNGKMGIVGNIYRGKVTRVLPGMQAAFVDIGQEKAAFLHASDIIPHTECVAEGEKAQFQAQDIASLVRPGQDIMVQVTKDPIGTKGARLTTDITLPSRYLVFMPGAAHVGVSQRVESEQERDRLKAIVGQFVDTDGGFIIRTAAEGATETELAHDAAFLRRVWRKVTERRRRPGGKVTPLYEDLTLPRRILRDLAIFNIERVQVDSRMAINELKEFAEEFVPDVAPVLEHYHGPSPLFDQFDVESDIQRSLERKVELKNGGYLIIDQTEAMTTIDINTGAFVGHRNLEETIFNTNLEACRAIAHQLRLRNLGGIIIVDFIDMASEEHRKRVLATFEQALAQDRVKTSISGFSRLGLVEVTRKRTRESLEHVLCGECPSCKGTGYMKTVETVCYEMYREIIRVDRQYDADSFSVYVSPSVYDALIGDEAHSLAELEVFIGKRVRLQPEPLYKQDKFDVVMM
ncbi:ribonuclease G [Ferrimonas aestuarii]|uniref:Ribonuclease G n=1 Tax=Ferrimonas aestuarii TaxID=2569539 RepID=A0A4U1BRD9_9GAMM|nr:ribonuclease G [Ferrimonas aestuarii]TKB55979.1 ribonuclease G [Ferrimonas aestuarii]